MLARRILFRLKIYPTIQYNYKLYRSVIIINRRCVDDIHLLKCKRLPCVVKTSRPNQNITAYDRNMTYLKCVSVVNHNLVVARLRSFILIEVKHSLKIALKN